MDKVKVLISELREETCSESSNLSESLQKKVKRILNKFEKVLQENRRLKRERDIFFNRFVMTKDVKEKIIDKVNELEDELFDLRQECCDLENIYIRERDNIIEEIYSLVKGSNNNISDKEVLDKIRSVLKDETPKQRDERVKRENELWLENFNKDLKENKDKNIKINKYELFT